MVHIPFHERYIQIKGLNDSPLLFNPYSDLTTTMILPESDSNLGSYRVQIFSLYLPFIEDLYVT